MNKLFHIFHPFNIYSIFVTVEMYFKETLQNVNVRRGLYIRTPAHSSEKVCLFLLAIQSSKLILIPSVNGLSRVLLMSGFSSRFVWRRWPSRGMAPQRVSLWRGLSEWCGLMNTVPAAAPLTPPLSTLN